MSKKFAYDYLDYAHSCKNEVINTDNKNYQIEYFPYIIRDIKRENEDNGFYYEYELTKQFTYPKYLRILIKNFTGKKMTIAYAKMSPTTLIIIIIVSVIAGIILIAATIIIIICCILRKRKVADVQQQYQSSFVNDQ